MDENHRDFEARWMPLKNDVGPVSTASTGYYNSWKNTGSTSSGAGFSKAFIAASAACVLLFLGIAGVNLHKVITIERLVTEGFKTGAIGSNKWPVNHDAVHAEGNTTTNTTADSCLNYLGMESDEIKDKDITASSFYGKGHEPYEARLNKKPGNGSSACWGGKGGSNEWIQADLGRIRHVTGVITQGRPSLPHQQWIESYKVMFGSRQNLIQYVGDHGRATVFEANFDVSTPVTNLFPEPVQARYIRIFPTSWHGNCMRFELLGC